VFFNTSSLVSKHFVWNFKFSLQIRVKPSQLELEESVERCEFLVCRSIGKNSVQKTQKTKSKNSPKLPKGSRQGVGCKALDEGRGSQPPSTSLPATWAAEGPSNWQPPRGSLGGFTVYRRLKGGASVTCYLPSPIAVCLLQTGKASPNWIGPFYTQNWFLSFKKTDFATNKLDS